MNKLLTTLFISVATLCRLYAQDVTIAKFTVHAGDVDRFNTPVSICLNGIDYNTGDGGLFLYEINNSGERGTPCQLEPGYTTTLWWVLSGVTKAGDERHFILKKESASSFGNVVTTELDAKKLTLKVNGVNVLQYNQAEVYPPEGVSSIYKRSGFIHPVWSPAGNVMTRINAPDHYHHMGIWNPWTKTLFHGHETDFWNLAKGEGTVRFAGFSSFISGAVFGGFKARHEHIDFQCKGPDQVAINEVWDVRVWGVTTPKEGKAWLWDMTTTLNCASDSSILLKKYRYGGGIGFRAHEEWTKENVRVITSEGKGRAEADGTRARWCDVSGEFAGEVRSGMLFMSHPANREHPEPMRVWPANANGGRGDLFFMFCPIRLNSWMLKPGNDYVLKYRMLVYDGEVDKKLAESLWNDFANPPVVEKVIK